VRPDLEQLQDADLAASLGHVGTAASPDPRLATTIPFTEGSSRGRFRILRPHAKGGLGQVSVALDQDLNREVALKEIQPRHADDPISRERFLLEAEITGALEHPGIVPVYALGQGPDGRPFYAMRFVKGDSLKQAIEDFHRPENPNRHDPGARQLALRRLLGRYIDVCNAMEYAHSRGVLHRDLKPGNIMVGKYGETLVVDWGLAKSVGKKEIVSDEVTLRPSSSLSTSGQTIAGKPMGTPAYMSPEQAAGKLEEMSPASDVYSLGATLYHLLCGRPPFAKEGSDTASMYARVQRGDFPKVRTVEHEVPPPLEAICSKAMAVKPADRYQTARALADDLEHWLADEPVAAAPDRLSDRLSRFSRRHRGYVRAGAVAIVVIAVVSIVAALLINEQRKANAELAKREQNEKQKAEDLLKERSALAAAKTELAESNAILARTADLKATESRRRLSTLLTSNGMTALDRGDQRHALSWMTEALRIDIGDSERESMDRTRIASVISNLLTPLTTEFHHVHFTGAALRPDGRRMHFQQRDGWGFIEQNSWHRMEFSPNGDYCLLVDQGRKFHLWNNRSHQKHVIPDMYLTDDDEYSDVLNGNIFDHSGRRIRGIHKTHNAHTFGCYNLETKSFDYEVPHDGGYTSAVSFHPHDRYVVRVRIDSTSMVVRPNRLISKDRYSFQVYDTETQQWRTLAVAEDQGLPPFWSPRFLPYDDQLALVGGGIWNLESGKQVVDKIIDDDDTYRISFSHDCRKVAQVRGVYVRVWSTETRQAVTPLLQHDSDVFDVKFFPDDSKVLALCGHPPGVSRAGDQKSFRVWNSNTGDPLTKSLPLPGESLTFRPDGRLFAVTTSSGVTLYDSETGKAATPSIEHDGAITSIQFAPDGRHLATCSDDGGFRLWDTSACETNVSEIMLQGGWPKELSSDCQTVAVATGDGFDILDTRTGEVEQSCEAGGVPRCFTYSPDGSRLLIGDLLGVVVVWDLRKAKMVIPPLNGHTLEGYGGTSRFGGFSRDSRFFATKLSSNNHGDSFQVSNAESGEPAAPAISSSSEIRLGTFSPDGDRIAIATANDLTVWDWRAGQLALSPITIGGLGGICALAFNQAGTRIVATFGYGNILCWDLDTGSVIWEQARQIGDGSEIRISSSDRILASSPHGVVLLDCDTGQVVRRFSDGRHADLDGQGSRLVVGNTQQARVFDAISGEPIGPFLKLGTQLNSSALSHDGRFVVLCGGVLSGGGSARIFDATTGEAVTSEFGGQVAFYRSGFAENPERAVIIGRQALVMWNLPTDTRPLDAIIDHTRLLSRTEVDSTGALVEIPTGPAELHWQALVEARDSTRQAEEGFSRPDWNRQEYLRAYRQQDWSAAIWHLDRILANCAGKRSFFIARAIAHANLSHWAESNLDFNKANSIASPRETLSGSTIDHALVLLAAKQQERYRDLCEQLVLQPKWLRDGAQIGFLADGITDRDSVLHIIAQIDVHDVEGSYPYAHLAGAGYYRIGEYDKAVDRLTVALKPMFWVREHWWEWIFLAMSHERLGNHNEALEWLARVKQWKARVEAAVRTGGEIPSLTRPISDWKSRLQFQVLEKEADALVRNGVDHKQE
jgi:serine/threonine protein kinase/WD40 repeat protein/tetratricopeptide (TPR) repeat protein